MTDWSNYNPDPRPSYKHNTLTELFTGEVFEYFDLDFNEYRNTVGFLKAAVGKITFSVFEYFRT